MYLCAILSLCCVSVQHVFWCYPYDVFSSVCISVLSSLYAVFQFSMCFGAILMMCSVCISMLSSPYAVFQFSVYFHTILSKQSTPNDMKSWLTKAPEDYFGRSALRCSHHPLKSCILSNSNAQIKLVSVFLFLKKRKWLSTH